MRRSPSPSLWIVLTLGLAPILVGATFPSIASAAAGNAERSGEPQVLGLQFGMEKGEVMARFEKAKIPLIVERPRIEELVYPEPLDGNLGHGVLSLLFLEGHLAKVRYELHLAEEGWTAQQMLGLYWKLKAEHIEKLGLPYYVVEGADESITPDRMYTLGAAFYGSYWKGLDGLGIALMIGSEHSAFGHDDPAHPRIVYEYEPLFRLYAERYGEFSELW